MAKLEVELKNITKVIKNKATDAIERFGGETEHLVKRMRQRGERTQHEGKKQLDRFVSQVKKSEVFSTASDYYEEVEKALEEKVTKVLDFLQIPRKNEMDALARKVKTLNEKLETLQKRGGAKRSSLKRKKEVSKGRAGKGSSSAQPQGSSYAAQTETASSGMKLN
ncbi:MAG: phasin family protein [Deltaproteobacteria bacterium]|nr:phasin family protein [Deltaproteobacteria bacterium]